VTLTGSTVASAETFRLHKLEVALATGIVIVDQITKALVRAHVPIYDSVTIIPGYLNLAHVRNSGAAFGFLGAVDFPYKSAILALVATAAFIGIAFYAARTSSHERLARFGLAMILAGAIGNLIDRLAFGSVIDFVDVVFGSWHFWAFNVADSAITLGVIAMLIDMMGTSRHVSKTS
jgi:signal peptidase II